MKKKVYFERAIFLSWYCKLADCKFCYMSLQEKKTDIKKARRRFSSILAEAIITRELGWKVEFISGGYDSFSQDELLFLIQAIHSIMKKKQWINIGTLSKKTLELFKPYIKGYAGTVETVNWKLRKKLCPSKDLKPILDTYKQCDDLKLSKAMTIIIGLGESIKDFDNLRKFIQDYNISRITFYALNPHPGTIFTRSPSKKNICNWIKLTRKTFPNIDIIAGAWTDKIDYYPALLKAGADSITKIPAIRKFNSKDLRQIQEKINKAGFSFQGSLVKMPNVQWQKAVDGLDDKIFDKELKNQISKKIQSYIKQMNKKKN